MSPTAVIRIEPVRYEARDRESFDTRSLRELLGPYFREAKDIFTGYGIGNLPYKLPSYTEVIDDCIPSLLAGMSIDETLQYRAEQKSSRKVKRWEMQNPGKGPGAPDRPTPRLSLNMGGTERQDEIKLLLHALERTGLSYMPEFETVVKKLTR